MRAIEHTFAGFTFNLWVVVGRLRIPSGQLYPALFHDKPSNPEDWVWAMGLKGCANARLISGFDQL